MSLEQDKDIIKEKTPPMPIGTRNTVYTHEEFLGIGKWEIIHEVSEIDHGWKDEYRRDPPKEKHCNILRGMGKAIS